MNSLDDSDFIYYQTNAGKILAVSCDDLRRFLIQNARPKFIKAIAELIERLGQALEVGDTAGTITL